MTQPPWNAALLTRPNPSDNTRGTSGGFSLAVLQSLEMPTFHCHNDRQLNSGSFLLL